VQEALSNVMKHAGARSAHVSLLLDEGKGVLRIRVVDDGAGFDTASASEGIGIIGMRERAYALHGTIEVRSSPGEGTDVAIALPLNVPAQPSLITPAVPASAS
jgi:two-component system sensor histidine kinase UhpB